MCPRDVIGVKKKEMDAIDVENIHVTIIIIYILTIFLK
jgi:hypothetical protein